MGNDISEQWNRREGYGGPESFPENDLAEFAVGTSDSLAGKKHTLYLEDGRIIAYSFSDAQLLSADQLKGGHGHQAHDCEYSASEAAPGVFFVKHGYNQHNRLTTCLVLDLNQNLATVIDGEVPANGDDDFRVRKSHTGGCIGEPADSGVIPAPQFPADLVGKHFVAEYSGRYAWELIYMNEQWISWQGLKGNPGIADTEEYHASSFEPGVYVVSWSEKAETLAAVFLYNFNTRTITGHMWGYAPELDKLLHAPLGARIVHPAEFGIRHKCPDDDGAEQRVRQQNIDVVLRSHEQVWNQKRYELIDELYAEDYQCHFICGLEASGRTGAREFISGHHQAFPDWTEKVVDVVADGDRVVTRYISTGTHKGDFQGIAATGRETTIAEVSIYRVLNGKIAEQWGFPDGLSHIQQLTQEH